jgi:hypothetical protein
MSIVNNFIISTFSNKTINKPPLMNVENNAVTIQPITSKRKISITIFYTGILSVTHGVSGNDRESIY